MEFLEKIKLCWKDVTTKRLKRDELYAFWKNPTKKNRPECYLAGGHDRSEALYSLIEKYAGQSDRILELGCNVGRNLNYLFSKGYKNLTGVDINEEAVRQLKNDHPDLGALCPCVVSKIEDFVSSAKDGSFDLIFTMAVLVHIHPESEFIFKHMARMSRRYIITFEGETSVSKRHFPRNYKNIFEPLGYHELYQQIYERPEGGLPLTVRVFEKKTGQ